MINALGWNPADPVAAALLNLLRVFLLPAAEAGISKEDSTTSRGKRVWLGVWYGYTFSL